MSTKINAHELAMRDVPNYVHATAYRVAAIEGYTTAINKVAKPIADERDELREALGKCANELLSVWRNIGQTRDNRHAVDALRILDKYANP
jgi:hypothetical protein